MASIEFDLVRLRGEYDRHSAERLESMHDLLSVVEKTPDDRRALEELHRHFHSLVGQGKTYGRPLATELADAPEARISILLRKGSRATQNDLEAWRGVVAELTAYFAVR